MPATRKTISEMCEEFGVTPRTLRFYETKALINPLRRGNRRLYSNSDRARMKLILRGKRFGFSLKEIRELLDLYHLGDQQHTQLTKSYEAGVRRLEQMRQQRDDLESAIAELQQQLKLGKRMLASLQPKPATE